MIIASYDADVLEQAFGIDMSSVEGLGTGAGWGRVAPGATSERHHHDETELFVVVAGSGEFLIDGAGYPAAPGTVILFEPFETHVLTNTGDADGPDLVFFTQYWRDAERAVTSAADTERKGFGDRPVFVFSTPPTPNGDLHLGHLSGPYLGADAFTRFQRMNGTEAYHLTGSDDYQSYVVGAARAEDRTPAETAAHYSAEIAETLRLMDIPLDQYTVTDQDPDYREGLKDFFSRVVASGKVAVTPHDALYDAESGRYLYEVDVKGGCPGCGHGTSGNICEECGEPNTVADLTDPRSAAAAPPVRGTAARWTLPLHEHARTVRDHHRLGRVPARLRELADRLFARPALDIPLTHPSEWGVEPREDATEGQVIWVWPEMSYGFLHGIQSLGGRLGRDWKAAEPAADWKIVHFFGYDNSFYHSVLYPVLYKTAFPGWQPDIDYHVNEFYLLEGEKFSTSRRHAIWGKEILTPDTVDAVRYFLSATRPEGLRTNFQRAAYEKTLDETLIGTWQAWLTDLGARTAKHHGGLAPDAGNWTPEHQAFLARLGARLTAVTGALSGDAFSLNQAAAELDGIVADTVRFARAESLLTDTAGWENETRTALALELAAARLLAHAAAPVMPRFAARLAAALGAPDAPSAWPRTVELLTPGTPVALEDAVFFTPTATTAGPTPLTAWLTTVVQGALRLEPGEPIAHCTLPQLAAGSLQAVTVQYQILDALDVDLSMDELLHGGTIAELAAVLAERAEPAAVAALTEGER